MIDQIIKAWKVSVPLVAIQTQDPTETITKIVQSLPANPPVIAWDVVGGMYGVNAAGTQALALKGIMPLDTQNPTEAMDKARELPTGGTVLFMIFGHMFMESESFTTGIWRLRDLFKKTQRMLVVLAPFVKLPGEISQDFLVLDDPLPSNEQVMEMVMEVEQSAKIGSKTFELQESDRKRAVNALIGLPRFASEQALYLSLTKTSFDWKMLSETKNQIVKQSGATVHEGPETFADVVGNNQLIEGLRAEITSKRPVRLVVYMDEIDKAIGTDLDTSGTSQAMKGMLLSFMEDNQLRGVFLVGVPGTGKSLTYKAMAGEADIPGVGVVLSELKGSLVGESEGNFKRVLSMIKAMGGRDVFVIATSNNIALVPAELRSRFYATYFFDLPDEAQVSSLWEMYTKKYNLTGELPFSEGWTGREIRNCCDLAWRLGISLKKAAQYIVPVSVSSHETIQRLRQEAAERFLSATHPGVYRIETKSERQGRLVSLED